MDSKLWPAISVALEIDRNGPLGPQRAEIVSGWLAMGDKATKEYKYADANALLRALEKKISGLFAQKHASTLATATGPSATPTQAKDAILAIPDKELRALGADNQLKLLDTLRKDRSVWLRDDPGLRSAAIKLYKNGTLDPGFRKQDFAKRQAVVDSLDPAAVKQAQTDWNDPVKMGPAKRKAFLKDVMKKQCQALGIPEFADDEVEFFSQPKTGSSISYGGFQKGPPRKMRLNEHEDAQDFKEQLVTVLHENTHNYQAALIAQVDTITDPAVKTQVEIFKLDTAQGYLPPGPDVGTAYDDQPKEEHAEEFAQYVVQKLLAPPP
jgi:hypothetical protein